MSTPKKTAYDSVNSILDGIMADAIIREMQKANFTYDDMISVIEMTREKLKAIKERDKSTKERGSDTSTTP